MAAILQRQAAYRRDPSEAQAPSPGHARVPYSFFGQRAGAQCTCRPWMPSAMTALPLLTAGGGSAASARQRPQYGRDRESAGWRPPAAIAAKRLLDACIL